MNTVLNLDRFESYIAGFADGDASICIGKCNSGFQLKVEFTQCNKQFLEHINAYFDNKGKIYTDSRKAKYINEQASSLRFCGKEAKPVLDIMVSRSIVKAEQARQGINYLQLINKQGRFEEKETFYLKLKHLNANKSSYAKDYTKINKQYIAGLFDAEGNVYYKNIDDGTRKLLKHYVKITQKSDPILLENIKNYLGYGKISPSEIYRLRFHSKRDILNFCKDVEESIIIKKEQLSSLKILLISTLEQRSN